MKKIIAMILSLTMILCMMPSVAFAAAPNWYNPSTTEYLITTPTMLSELALGVNDGSIKTENIKFKLGGTIDMSGETSWTGIGTDANPFKGTFDGQGNTITGLKSSLFGTVTDSTIINIKFVTPFTVDGPTAINKIVDGGTPYSIVENISANKGSGYGNYVINGIGGIIGTIENTASLDVSNPFNEVVDATRITKCSNAVTVNSTTNVAGGIIGSTTGLAFIGGNVNTSTVTVTSADGYAGGIVGIADGIFCSKNNTNSNYGVISAYSTGTTIGGTAGGIAGKLSKSAMQSVINSGTINGLTKGNLVGVGTGSNNIYGVSDNGTLPIAGLWKSNLFAQSVTFTKDFYIEGGCSVMLTSSNIYNIVPISDNASISISNGTVNRISTKQYDFTVTVNDATVSTIEATDRKSGTISANTIGTGTINNIIAGTVNVVSNKGRIGSITIENAITIGAGVKFPDTLTKYGTDIDYKTLLSGLSYNRTAYSYSNPTYYVYTVNYGASIGNIKYATLSDAFANAKNADTIVALVNTNNLTEQTIEKGKNITLDLNGKTITIVNGSFVVNGTLTIKDSQNGTGILRTMSFPASKDITGKLIIKSGTFNCPPYEYVLNTSTATYSPYTKLFTVKDDMKIDGCTAVLDYDYYTYNGKDRTPIPTVTDGNKTLIKDIDYSVGYYGNRNAGKASVILYGKGQYTGTKTITFLISPANVTSARLVPINNQGYTGYYIQPEIDLTLDLTKLVNGVDYTVTCTNNLSKGTAVATIIGRGNYTGTRTEQFKIAEPIPMSAISPINPEYKYLGVQIRPNVTVLNLRNGIDFILEYGENIKAGVGTVTVVGIGNYGGKYQLRFNIVGETQLLTTRWSKYSKLLTSPNFNLGASALGGVAIYYASQDNSVATVDYLGNVTIKDTGIARIRVYTLAVGAYPATEKMVTVTVKPSRAVYTVTSPSYNKMKVRITKAPGVTKYQIRYGRNGNYKNSYYTYSNSSYDTQSRTFTGLRSGSKYYVKVRAYKTMADGQKAWGNWGTIKAVRIK